MLTVKIVESGYGQAVRLPEEYRFEQEEITAIRLDQAPPGHFSVPPIGGV